MSWMQSARSSKTPVASATRATSAAPSPPRTVMTFARARARFIRITATATSDSAPPWAIQRIRVYQPATGGTR